MKITIYGGKKDLNLKKYSNVYCIDIGRIKSKCNYLTDLLRFNEIALEYSNKYADYIYSFNKKYFLENKLIFNNKISFYFISELSNKRTEKYKTYHHICHALLIKEIIENENIQEIEFLNCEYSFVLMLKDYLIKNNIKIVLNKSIYNNLLIKKFYKIFYLYKQFLFLIKIIVSFIVLKLFYVKKNTKEIENIFLTRYPLHLNNKFRDDKYSDYVKENDMFLVSILTDGFHQNLNLIKLIKSLIKINYNNKSVLLEKYLYLKDILIFLKIVKKLLNQNIFYDSAFEELNLKFVISNEIFDSFLKIPRLLLYYNSIKRVFKKNKINCFYLYLHEYVYGRLFSIVINIENINVNVIGFQHGPASKRKLLYVLSKDEFISFNEKHKYKKCLTKMFLPDKILCEDLLSKCIYENNGYSNVYIMEEIYRLKYLKNVKINNDDSILVVGGLHDSQILYEYAKKLSYIESKKVIFKKHPMARVKFERNNNNFYCSNEDINYLLSKSRYIYVTYSSVGVEAYNLNKIVNLILLPNKINESPLLDIYQNSKNIKITDFSELDV